MPSLVDGGELLDGRVVVTVLQLADLNLVDAVELVRVQVQLAADLGGRLRGTKRDRMRDNPDVVAPVLRERARLFPAPIGELPSGRAGIEPAVDVADRLAVTNPHQSAAHRLPSLGHDPR